ncbi:MAG: hypothetical protein PHS41_09335 [Victivallaceae bacterium]|nr:hypothetical protein [Victivallaceae bacterium]
MGIYAAVGGDDKLIPYWQTKVGSYTDIISWNATYNSDVQLLKCCRGESVAPKGADYVLLGDMTGDGRCGGPANHIEVLAGSLFRIMGVFLQIVRNNYRLIGIRIPVDLELTQRQRVHPGEICMQILVVELKIKGAGHNVVSMS